MNIKIYFIALIVIVFTHHAYCSQTEQPIIYAIPGLLGNDSNCGYSENILALFPDHTIVRNGTLSIAEKPDFGQKRCVNHLKSKIQEHHSTIHDKDKIIVATSQGTATITNLLAEQNNPTSQQLLNKVKLVIFEGYAASFNLCISHVVETQLPCTRFLPFKYYWLPYLAKFLPYFGGTWFPLWHYNPAAQQPIEVLQKISTDIPIIFVHGQQDRLTPFDGALAAIHQLITTKHQIYLISTEIKQLDKNDLDDGHINIKLNNECDKRLKEIIPFFLSNNTKSQTRQYDKYQQKSTGMEYRAEAAAKKILFQEKMIKKFDLFLRASPFILFLFFIFRITKQHINAHTFSI